ncbi:MAG: TrkH family potassium uptake protein [Acidobacteriia bacterium]|nr:TrkH family potassium uptake protein [Terriglobia bacterium]
MIRFLNLWYIIGNFLIALSGIMLVPLALAFWNGNDVTPLGYSCLITIFLGISFRLAFPKPNYDLNRREALLLVCLIWFLVCFFGSLPFYFSGYFPSFTDAFFEATSGFTATGATVLNNVEILTLDIQLWRHLAHWLGGMGIVLLGIAILPLIGMGGMSMYRAEFSGAKSEKLRPRVTQTALALWKIYLSLSFLAFCGFYLVGMNIFDSICHAFTVAATGGFSTRTASLGAFQNPGAEYVALLFMVLSGMNFTLHYRLWVELKLKRLFLDTELKMYFLLLIVSSLLVFSVMSVTNQYPGDFGFRRALFQVVSILTTTGLTTDNFSIWLPFPQLILLVLMFSGGCTGSTSGGLKVSRMLLLGKVVSREFKRMVERRGVFPIKIGRQFIAEETLQSLLNLFYLAFLINFVSCLLLAASGVDVFTSISAVAACMFNIGPGLGSVGPTEGYGNLPGLAKWILSFCMLAGRLEFYTAIVIFTPGFWKK